MVERQRWWKDLNTDAVNVYLDIYPNALMLKGIGCAEGYGENAPTTRT